MEEISKLQPQEQPIVGVDPTDPIANKLNIKRYEDGWDAIPWGLVSTLFGFCSYKGITWLGITKLVLSGVTISGSALLFGPLAFCAGTYTIGKLINVFAPGHAAGKFFKSVGKVSFGLCLVAVGTVLLLNPALLGVIGAFAASLGPVVGLTFKIGVLTAGTCSIISNVCPRIFKRIAYWIGGLFGLCAAKDNSFLCESPETCERYLEFYKLKSPAAPEQEKAQGQKNKKEELGPEEEN